MNFYFEMEMALRSVKQATARSTYKKNSYTLIFFL